VNKWRPVLVLTEVTVEYFRGLPQVTVPLPSRRERCRFTLRPISNTVGDFLAMLCHEDRGIDRVAVSSLGGSDSCTVGTVVRQECVSDICFNFKVSNFGGNSLSVSDRIGTVKHMHFRIMQSEDCILVGGDTVSLGQQFATVEGSSCVCLPSGTASHPRRLEFSATPLHEPQMSHYLNCLQMELELHLLIQ